MLAFIWAAFFVTVGVSRAKHVRRAYEEVGDFPHLLPYTLLEMRDYDYYFEIFSVCQTSQKSIDKYVKFRLYTQSNPTTPHLITLGNKTTLGPFDPTLPVMTITHGFRSSAISMETSENFLPYAMQNQNWNVIFVDWSVLASDVFYPCTARKALQVGAQLGRFIDWLNTDCGTNSSQFHLVGHSLGAHASGKAGESVTTGKVARITGLDPAGPLFDTTNTYQRLDLTDAIFVDVIHSSAGDILDCALGTPADIGHVNFHPNGGSKQRECGKPDKYVLIFCADACSHHSSISYFAESLHNKEAFKSYACTSAEAYDAGNCFPCNPCNRMGYYVDHNINGSFYLSTREMMPFNGRQILTKLISKQELEGTIYLVQGVDAIKLLNKEKVPINKVLSQVLTFERPITTDILIYYSGDPAKVTLDSLNFTDVELNKKFQVNGPIDLVSKKYQAFTVSQI